MTKKKEGKDEGFIFAKKTIELEFITELLGTVPKNKEIYADHVLKKAIEKGVAVNPTEELETVEDLEEKGWTGFHVTDYGICLRAHMIKGNIKANLQTLIMSKQLNKIPAYLFACDRCIHVYPRIIPIKKEPDGVLERPLRAETPKGARVALSKSDYVDVGTKIRFDIKLLENPKISISVIEKALDYGEFYGLGQWRGSGGYGQYVWRYV